jgi:5-oxopent-3-ene-1,2,5-tricarboxylate decarboxylase / 2-hydroxyhepta-2,4-diene-1,7-dioate isomerase
MFESAGEFDAMTNADASIDVSDDILRRFEKVSLQSCAGALSYITRQATAAKNGDTSSSWTNCYMKNIKPLTPGRKIAARARTLSFLPPRPDMAAKLRRGENSPEFEAMESCGPGDILVIDANRMSQLGILGNMKTRLLWQRGATGLITDASVRDLDKVRDDYGMAVFGAGRSAITGLAGSPFHEVNVPISCDGVLVVPGDVMVADDDGVVVIPQQLAEQVIDWIEEHDLVEDEIARMVDEQQVSPGRFYPPSEELRQRVRDEQARNGE